MMQKFDIYKVGENFVNQFNIYLACYAYALKKIELRTNKSHWKGSNVIKMPCATLSRTCSV